MGLGIRVSPKGCLPTALPCRAKGKQAAQRGFQGRGNNWDTSISRKTSFELVTPCHLCKTRKGGRLETLPRVITKPSTPTQSHAEVWIPRGSQKGPTPWGLMIFAILRAALAFPHIHSLSSYGDFTVLQSPPDTCHQKITACQAEQAGAESQALPHSIPGENKHSWTETTNYQRNMDAATV